MWISSADSFYRPFLRGRRGDTSADGGDAARGHVHPPDPRRASIRTRRRLVSSLRTVAKRTLPRDPARWRLNVLLYNRVPTMRDDRLETAALLESAIKPGPKCVSALRRLLTDGCESPLYNIDVRPSEPRVTPYHVRSRLPAASARPVPSE
jgi:hypothetical protein